MSFSDKGRTCQECFVLWMHHLNIQVVEELVIMSAKLMTEKDSGYVHQVKSSRKNEIKCSFGS